VAAQLAAPQEGFSSVSKYDFFEIKNCINCSPEDGSRIFLRKSIRQQGVTSEMTEIFTVVSLITSITSAARMFEVLPRTGRAVHSQVRFFPFQEHMRL
jgi:hypothetical protein